MRHYALTANMVMERFWSTKKPKKWTVQHALTLMPIAAGAGGMH